MIKFYKISFILVLAIFGIFFFQNQTQAAILFTAPHQQEINQGETFLVEIRLDSANEVINAVEGQISYPVNLVEAIEVSQGGSFLTIWPVKPTVDKAAGLITFTGGIPQGSLVVNGKILTVTFRAKNTIGTAEIEINTTQSGVYLNDGLGTRTDLRTLVGSYQISESAVSDLVINSSTHPQENQWYAKSTALLSWQLKEGALYSYKLSRDALTEPDDEIEEVIGEVSYTDLSDGIYYFFLKEKSANNDWSKPVSRKLLIDVTPPQSFQVLLSQEINEFAGQYFLTFATHDLTSGIDQYQVLEGNQLYSNAESPFILKDQTRSKAITVKAIDKAGNVSESTLLALPQKKTDRTLAIIVVFGVILIVVIITTIFIKKKQKKQ